MNNDREFDEGWNEGGKTLPPRIALSRGDDGIDREYTISKMGRNFPDMPGSYVFAEQDDDQWRLIYVDHGDSLKAEVHPNHKMWEKARARGATHVLYRTNPFGRDALEREKMRRETCSLIVEHRPDLS